MLGKIFRPTRLLAFVLCSAFLFCSFGNGPAWAQESHIGFLDLQKAVSGTGEWKMKLNNFRKRFDQEKSVIAAREEKIKEMLDDLNKKSFVLNPDLKNKKESEFRQAKKDFERYVQDKNEDFSKKEKEITAEIVTKMMKVIQKIGKEKNYAMVLEQKIGLYFDKKHDLTALAIASYNKMYK